MVMQRPIGDIPFRHVIVDADNPPNPHCKAAGDLDGDGNADLLAASASGGGLYWYRYPHWSKHLIAEGAYTTDMAVADIDGDGNLDVVIPSHAGLIWYRNPMADGGDPTQPWEAFVVSSEGARMHDVEVADLDGDGRMDIVTRHQSGFGKRLGNEIHLWHQLSPTAWEHHTFPCPHGEGLALADLNGNGRPDVVIGGRWYENPGNPWQGEWVEHLYIDPEHFDKSWTRGDVVVQTGDLDGDGHLEIVLSPAEGIGRLSYFEAPARAHDSYWIEYVLARTLDHAHGLAVGDVDLDGRPDIIVAKMHQATVPQDVCVYRNRVDGVAWHRQVISTHGSHNIALVEIGGSGRLSIFGANWNDDSSTRGALELWVNEMQVE